MSDCKSEVRWLSPAFAAVALGAPGWVQESIRRQAARENAVTRFMVIAGSLTVEGFRTATNEVKRRTEFMTEIDAMDSVTGDIAAGRIR